MLSRHVYCDPSQSHRPAELSSEYLAAKCFDRLTLAVNHFDGQPPELESIYLSMSHGSAAACNGRSDRRKIVKRLHRVWDAMIRLPVASFVGDLMVLLEMQFEVIVRRKVSNHKIGRNGSLDGSALYLDHPYVKLPLVLDIDPPNWDASSCLKTTNLKN